MLVLSFTLLPCLLALHYVCLATWSLIETNVIISDYKLYDQFSLFVAGGCELQILFVAFAGNCIQSLMNWQNAVTTKRLSL